MNQQKKALMLFDAKNDSPYLFNLKALWRQREKRKQVYLAFFGALFVIYMAIITWFFGSSIGRELTDRSQIQMAARLFVLAYGALTLFMTVPYLVSKLLFDKNVKSFRSLPFSLGYFLEAKLDYLMLNEGILLLLFLPGILGIVQNLQPFLLSALGVLLFMLCYGLLVILLAAILVMVVATFFHLGKKGRKGLQLLGFLALFAIIIGINLITQTMVGDNLTWDYSFVRFFPLLNVTLWGASSFPSLASWATLGGFAFLLFLLRLGFGKISNPMAEKIFDNISREDRVEKRKAGKEGMSRSVALNFFLMDWKDIVSTPIFLWNSVASAFLVPVAFAVPLMNRSAEILPSLQNLGKSEDFPVAILILGIAWVVSLFMSVSSTSFSREGNKVKSYLTLPIKPLDIVRGKVLSHTVFCLLVVVVYSLLGFWLLRTPLVFLSIFVGIPIYWAQGATGLLVDILRPKFHWENPQQVIKNNLNVLFAMILWGLVQLPGVIILLVAFIAQHTVPGLLFSLFYFILMAWVMTMVAKKALAKKMENPWSF